jgi:hypothetical protein
VLCESFQGYAVPSSAASYPLRTHVDLPSRTLAVAHELDARVALSPTSTMDPDKQRE